MKIKEVKFESIKWLHLPVKEWISSPRLDIIFKQFLCSHCA